MIFTFFLLLPFGVSGRMWAKGSDDMPEFVVKDIYESGDLVQLGNYVCCTCEEFSCIIQRDGGKLPDCPTCGKTYWIKY